MQHENANVGREGAGSREKPAEAQAVAVERVKSSRREASPEEQEEKTQAQLRKTIEKVGIGAVLQALIDYALDKNLGRVYDTLDQARAYVENT